jgi:endonuclease G
MSSGSLKPYAMSIDKVEEITGIDFFPSLEDDLEDEVESQFDASAWNFDILDL